MTLETDLRESRAAVEDREKEIDNIHQSYKTSKDNEADTIQAMHNQISDLQKELEELRSVTKAHGQMSRSHDDEDREVSPYDQNGRQISGAEPSERVPQSDERTRQHRKSPDQVYTPGGQTFDQHSQLAADDQEDSGHQSFDPQYRGPQFSPEGQSLSPRQLGSYVVDPLAEEIQRSEAVQSYRTPTGSRPGSAESERVHSSACHSRTGSAHSVSSPAGSKKGSSRGSSRQESPHTVGTQDGITQAYSPPTRDSPLSQSSHKGEGLHTHKSSAGSSPVQGSEGQSRILPQSLTDQYQQGLERQPSPVRSQASDKLDQGQRSLPRRTQPMDGNGQEHDGFDEQMFPVERQTVGSSFSIDEERQVYQAKPRSAYSESERYVDDDGSLYDRDGNIRPRFSQVLEGQSGQDQRSGQAERPEQDDERAHYQRQHPSEGQEAPASRLPLAEGQGQSEGQVSTEAERYIQQLRRELLITKTALMQIQRGERLDNDGIPPSDLDDMGTEGRSDIGQGDTGFRSTEGDRNAREMRYDIIPSEESLNELKRKLERAEEELELYRSSSDISARDFVQASLI